MGYEANIKSAQSERRQRLIIIISVIAISTACFTLISLLRAPAANGGAIPVSQGQARMASVMAAAKKNKDKKKGTANLRTADVKEVHLAAAAAVTSNADNNKKQVEPKKKDVVLLPHASQKSEKEAATIRADLESQVRSIKATGVIMETDPHSLEFTGKLQEATRELIGIRYGNFGDKRFRVKLELEFQSTIPDFEEKGSEGSLLLELAPISLLPCSAYNFLEIARTWKKGAFHRNANHVLQAISRSDITKSMPFQEYHKDFPHKKGTMGYAGRPSGPEFYVSIENNTRAHGPGSQQKHNPHEADVAIGTIIEGIEDGTVARIHTMPGKEFMGDKLKWVLIRRMHILVPSGEGGEYVEFSSSPEVIPKD